jgi:hypothetical protein
MAAVTLVVSWPLFGSDWFQTHERTWYPMRVFALDRMLGGGATTLRWSSDLYQGYGYPFFNFYPPLTFLAAEGFHLLGLAIPDALKAVLVFATFVQQVFVYRLVRDLWGRPAGLVAAVAYAMAPYRIANVFWRGALAEYVAGAVFPAVLYLFRRFLGGGGRGTLAWAAIAYALLVFTHNLSALVFTAVLAAFVVFETARSRVGTARFLLAAVAGATGLLLAAAFWIPAFFEKDLVRIDLALQGWFDYRQHFQPVAALVASIGEASESARGVGAALVGAGIVAAATFATGARQHVGTFLFFLLLGAASVALVTPASDPAWRAVPLLRFMQFPWRLLMVASLCAAITTGALLRGVGGRAATWLPLAASLAIVLLHGWYLGLCRPIALDPVQFDAAHYLAEKETLSFDEYTPRWVQKEPPKREVDVRITSGTGRVLSEERGQARLAGEVETPGDARVSLSTFYFPGWRAAVDGETVESEPDGDGLLSFAVPAGRHRVEAHYAGTDLEVAADVLSLLGLVALAALRWGARRGLSAL